MARFTALTSSYNAHRINADGSYTPYVADASGVIDISEGDTIGFIAPYGGGSCTLQEIALTAVGSDLAVLINGIVGSKIYLCAGITTGISGLAVQSITACGDGRISFTGLLGR